MLNIKIEVIFLKIVTLILIDTFITISSQAETAYKTVSYLKQIRHLATAEHGKKSACGARPRGSPCSSKPLRGSF